MEKEMKKYVIIAGAGISMDAPANLPSWWQYNKKMIDVIKEQALKLCPDAEKLLQKIDVEKSLPVQCISDIIVKKGAGDSYFPLLELLNGTVANANHFALAELARRGIVDTMITTNFDTLIETAFMEKAISLTTIVEEKDYFKAPGTRTCRLLKIHGSVKSLKSFIDTVTQKACGLSMTKRFILKQMLDHEIIFMGFSGADLDFDMDYIPIQETLNHGNHINWILHPGSRLNRNAKTLQKKYPEQFHVYEAELSEVFRYLGADYHALKNELYQTEAEDNSEVMEERMRKLFSSPHIGAHGCMGMCISLLDMIGESQAASELAEIYTKTLNLKNLNIFSVTGIFSLGLQKMNEGKIEDAKRYFMISIQCFQRMLDLLNKVEKNDKTADILACRHEVLENLGKTYNNLGLLCMEESDTEYARKYFEFAKDIAENRNNLGLLGISTFNLARLAYRKDHENDKFLLSLHISEKYVKKAGNLHAFLEMLLEECEIRLKLGEYYFAQKILEQCKMYLCNIREFRLNVKTLLIQSKYHLRIRKKQQALENFWQIISLEGMKSNPRLACNLLLEAVRMFCYFEEFQDLAKKLCNICGEKYTEIKQIWQKFYKQTEQEPVPNFITEDLPDDKIRQEIILVEYQQERKNISSFFAILCEEYMKFRKWERLQEIAECCYVAAMTPKQQSAALYFQGCAAIELKNYRQSEKYYRQVIQLNKSAESIYLGWSYLELAVLSVIKKDMDGSIQNCEMAKHSFQKSGLDKEWDKACCSYIRRIWDKDYTQKVWNYMERIQKEIDNPNLNEFWFDIKNKMNEKKEKSMKKELDIEKAMPEEIATEALRLYDTGTDQTRAWKLIHIALEKYREMENMDGVGKCENNMANFCIHEKKLTEAAQHFNKALDIKEQLGDIKGTAEQLSNLISLLTQSQNLKQAVPLVERALRHLLEYEYWEEKYLLFYSLFYFYMLKKEYATALHYAKLAKENIPYLMKAGVSQDGIDTLEQYVQTMENEMKPQKFENDYSDLFLKLLNEASRLYKMKHFSECHKMLNQLYAETKENSMRFGQILGTKGNAYLQEGLYKEAIDSFERAKGFFHNVKDIERKEAANYLMTVLNGICLALDGLGQTDKAIALLEHEIELEELTQANEHKWNLIITLCNRLIKDNQDTIQYKDTFFCKILNYLDQVDNQENLSHEIRGVLYSSYGSLYCVTEKYEESKRYYELAEKEFLLINSPNMKKVEQMLNVIKRQLQK